MVDSVRSPPGKENESVNELPSLTRAPRTYRYIAAAPLIMRELEDVSSPSRRWLTEGTWIEHVIDGKHHYCCQPHGVYSTATYQVQLLTA